MTPKPLQRLSEFAAEVRLSKAKYLVVEGPNDRRFFAQWLSDTTETRNSGVTVISVDSLDVDAGLLLAAGLNDGARSRVVHVATFAAAEALPVRCVADLDCGHDVSRFKLETLLWTDFPAVESYGFEARALDALNRLFVKDKLTEGTQLVRELSPILLELFTVRMNNRHLPRPEIARAVTQARGEVQFDVKRAVPSNIANLVDDYARPSYTDPRSHAYGHDICAALMALYANTLRNQARIRDQDALEEMLRAAILIATDLRKFALFRKIEVWAT